MGYMDFSIDSIRVIAPGPAALAARDATRELTADTELLSLHL